MFAEILKNCRYGDARVSSKSQEDNLYLEEQKKKFLKLDVLAKILEYKQALTLIKCKIVFFSIIKKK